MEEDLLGGRLPKQTIALLQQLVDRTLKSGKKPKYLDHVGKQPASLQVWNEFIDMKQQEYPDMTRKALMSTFKGSPDYDEYKHEAGFTPQPPKPKKKRRKVAKRRKIQRGSALAAIGGLLADGEEKKVKTAEEAIMNHYKGLLKRQNNQILKNMLGIQRKRRGKAKLDDDEYVNALMRMNL